MSAVVRPWYRQFYLRRGPAPWASDEVSSDGYATGVEAIGGFVYVGTTMYGSPTNVTIEVSDAEPANPHGTDRSATVTIRGEGSLALLSWGEDEPVAIAHAPEGPLRCRVIRTGTDAASNHPDVEGGGESLSPEAIVIQVWPGR